MQIRYLKESDDRLAVSRIYEESWKYAYRGIVPQPYLDNLSEGRWGAALLEQAMEALAKQGFSQVFLWVLEENTRARGFYEHMGFQNSGAYMDSEIGGKLLRELRYVRSLR